MDDQVLEWCPPRVGEPPEDWQTCLATHWLSACGRYRVTALEPIIGYEPEPARFGSCFRGPQGIWYSCERDACGRAVYRRSLAAAFRAVESFHREACGLARVRLTTNADAMVALAENTGVAPEVSVVATKTKSAPKARKVQADTGIPGFGKIPPAPKGSPAAKGKKKTKVAMSDVVAAGREHLEGPASPVVPKARKKAKAPVVAEPVPEAVAADVAPPVAVAPPTVNDLPAAAEIAPVAPPAVDDSAFATPPPAMNGKPLSQVEAAAKVLGEDGIPMKVGRLIAVMAERGYWKSPGGKTPQNTLYSALLRDITVKGVASRFRRTSEGFRLA